MIGVASGLYGFMQMANGALCTLAVGFFPANPALSAARVLLAGILLGQYFFLCATRTRSGAGGWTGDRVCARFGRAAPGSIRVPLRTEPLGTVSEASSLLLYLLAAAPAEPPQADKRAAKEGQRGRLGDRF